MNLRAFSALLGASSLAGAQKTRSNASNDTIRTASTIVNGADVTSRQVPTEICGNAPSFAGYVNFAPDTMKDISQPSPMHFFYWFFPAQKGAENSPVVVWLNGGPGSGDEFGLFGENGPCKINRSFTQTPNPFSWNQAYNMLYIDQPMGAGFSYDVETKGVLDLTTGDIKPSQQNETGPESPTMLRGVFASQNPASTANTTKNAARHFWNFMQVWSEGFLKDHASDGKLSIWAESFGGHYGPVFAKHIQDQNARIRKGDLANAKVLDIPTVGIMNGCIDAAVELSVAADYGFDGNAFGIQAITRDQRDEASRAFSQRGGCRDKIVKCNELADRLDPDGRGNVAEVNEACVDANDFCTQNVQGSFFNSRRSTFDMTQCSLAGSPETAYWEYLRNERVLEALGVPVNLTDFSNTAFQALTSTGEQVRIDRDLLASLVDSGTQVAMVYGDRDYICNWKGGERVSLASRHNQAAQFRQSGYADVTINGGKPVGQVRQHDSFSFTRVFQASHLVAFTQPEAGYTVFDRAMQRKDIATGQVAVDKAFSTKGPANSTATFEAKAVAPVCQLLGLAESCAQNQIEAVGNGTATIENGVITSPGLEPGACP